MFKLLPRRTMLRGTGVAIGLPMLECMTPVIAAQTTPTTEPRRMVAHGGAWWRMVAHGGAWWRLVSNCRCIRQTSFQKRRGVTMNYLCTCSRWKTCGTTSRFSPERRTRTLTAGTLPRSRG